MAETVELKKKPPISYPEKITLLTVDQKKMVVDFVALKDSKVINMIDSLMCEDTIKELTFPLHDKFATEATLRKAFEWMERNAGIELKPEDMESKIKLDAKQIDFFAQLDIDAHIGLILAANYLNTLPLLHYSLQALADKMSAMNVDALRSAFAIPAPSSEEERALRAKFAWALEEPSKQSK
uniref:S-phase kinase-associated protein 1 n=1 Tax=Plectus sambesii TaxID=2011161 RepID=A0A914XGF9_9BILA